MIRVVNKRYHTPTNRDVYIGRGSCLGNPFSHLKGTKAKHFVPTRNDAINSYRLWISEQVYLYRDMDIRTALNAIYLMAKSGDVNLVCYCAPEECHGDVIKQLVEEKLK